MKSNLLFKILSSIPIILITLYFIPFLGICLIIFRYFVYSDRKRVTTPIIIVGVGFLILVPKGLYLILEMVNFRIDNIPYLENIVNSDLYNINFIDYSKILICVGIITLIILFVLKTIYDKVSNKLNIGIRNYINETERRNDEIARKNDM